MNVLPGSRTWAWLGSVALIGAVLAGCGVPGPDGRADTFGLDFTMPARAATPGAIVFYVDGVNAGVFEEMLGAGELPAIKRYFVDRGLYCPRAVAGTPSVTLANMTSFVTGLLPGHHGITGVNGFDRNQLLWRNYETIAQKNTLDGDYTAANIYEQFPDRTTFSIFFQPHRGATKFVENWTSAGPPFFFGWYEFVDRLTLFRFNVLIDVARKRGHFPAVTIAYLLAPDFRAYACGVDAEPYRQALRHTDRQIGRVLGDLERAGLLEKLIIALVSDHSLCEVKRHFPIERFLSKQVGLRIAPARLWDQTPFEKRLDYYRKYNAVLYGSGDRYWALCLRKPVRDENGMVIDFEPWTVRPSADDLKDYPTRVVGAAQRGPSGIRAHGTPKKVETANLIELLTAQEAVDAVAYAAGENRVRVRTKSGEVEFAQADGPGGPITCSLLSGSDPLGWQGKLPDDVLDGRPLGGRRWLELTAATEFPDLPAQILAYFRARRAGDIAVFAAPGWDFRNVNRAGHGGLRPGDMHVPLLLAGPGVPHGRISVARTVDVMPTLLTLLGRPVPGGLDGRSLCRPSR